MEVNALPAKRCFFLGLVLDHVNVRVDDQAKKSHSKLGLVL